MTEKDFKKFLEARGFYGTYFMDGEEVRYGEDYDCEYMESRFYPFYFEITSDGVYYCSDEKNTTELDRVLGGHKIPYGDMKILRSGNAEPDYIGFIDRRGTGYDEQFAGFKAILGI